MGGFGFSPFGNLGGSGDGPDDLSGKIPLFAELQRLLAGNGGPVNWDLARQLAISNLALGHRSVSAEDTAAVQDVLRLADIWLDAATDLPSGITTIEAWSPVDWVEKTMPVWSTLCDPVASRVGSAMSGMMPESMQGMIPDEMTAQLGQILPMMSQLTGLFFGAQLGQGLAALAGEVVSSTDIGLPLGPTGTAALVLRNADALAESLERPVSDVRLFLALREAAHQRLFAHVSWLRQQVIEAVDAYGRGIKIDPTAISNAMAEIDPTNPESLQAALSSGMFEPENTAEQDSALRRLETLLALIEGWVDAVVADAMGERLPSGAALTEAMRRRRASGGPAEQTFATLVGLELRPRRLRDATTLWAGMGMRHGTTARDSLWNHPDLLPTADDLDDAIAFVERHGEAFDFDAALTELSAQEEPAQNKASGGESATDSAMDSPGDSAGDAAPEQSSESAPESGDDQPAS